MTSEEATARWARGVNERLERIEGMLRLLLEERVRDSRGRRRWELEAKGVLLGKKQK